MRDPRTLRLFDMEPHERVEVRCLCGHISYWPRGSFQRQRRLPSDMLIFDLQYWLRCTHCNRRSGFLISLVDWRNVERIDIPKREIVIVDDREGNN